MKENNYINLLHDYNDLLDENEKLKEENKKLKLYVKDTYDLCQKYLEEMQEKIDKIKDLCDNTFYVIKEDNKFLSVVKVEDIEKCFKE